MKLPVWHGSGAWKQLWPCSSRSTILQDETSCLTPLPPPHWSKTHVLQNLHMEPRLHKTPQRTVPVIQCRTSSLAQIGGLTLQLMGARDNGWMWNKQRVQLRSGCDNKRVSKLGNKKKKRKKDRVLDLMFCFVCSYVGNKVFLRNTTHGLKIVTRRYLHACVLKWKLLFLNNYY